VGASLTIRPSATLTTEQRDALVLAVQTLPDTWRLQVYADTVAGPETHSFTVRIVGPDFTAISPFRAGSRPEKLAAFVERVRLEHPA
jgi:hypothetical protein